MFNYHDQADGLRRIMAKSSAHLIGVLAANGQPAGAWLNQLAASMVRPEQRTLLVQAIQRPVLKYSLQAVVQRKSILSRAIVKHPQGYDLASLTENNALTTPLSADLKTQMSGIVKQLAYDYETVIIEASLDPHDQTLMLPILAQHALIIQMERNEEAIKSAYVMIKRICQQYGPMALSIMVTGSTTEQGQQYFMRLNQVCEQFLGLSLHFLGAIPEANIAQKTGGLQSAVAKHRDALATTVATQSMAFKAIASRLEKQRLTTPSLAAA